MLLDGPERESLRLAATRIGAFPCRWDGCDAVLNCADSLLKHLNEHPPELTPNNVGAAIHIVAFFFSFQS